MKHELIAKKMTEIDDRYILESDPDTVAAAVYRPSRFAAVADFFSHGWGVAIISGFVALSVLGGIVAAGQINPGTTPAGTLPPNTLSSEPEETEALTEAPQPTPVYTEGLEFRVEPSGEATLIGMGTATDTVLRIPPKDPSGHPVTMIWFDSFKGNTAITEVILPASIYAVLSGSFADCTSLERVTVEGDKKVILQSNCFENCPKLTDVRLHEKVACSDYCFNGTPWLASRTEEFVIQGQCLLAYNGEGGDVVIPAEVAYISGTVFAGNTTIRSITVPDTGVNMSVGNEAFRGCTALETVDLPFLVAISGNPFAECTALKTVYLPASLYSMGEMNELPENVVFHYAGTKAQWKQIIFLSEEDRALMEEQVIFEGE
ncbi:MAG: leucine-rich repeat domain-containing protein [Clostridia bacterium]|nr:leucine-rich repeat domain-containing protein [Clostridia bacterium]